MSDINHILSTSSGAVIEKFAVVWAVALCCRLLASFFRDSVRINGSYQLLL
jgi:hypothetical protein